LPPEEKQHNRALAQMRVRVEHGIRRFKIFRIFGKRVETNAQQFTSGD